MTADFDATVAVRPIGHVESPLVDVNSAPRQGEEGAPDAWLVFTTDVAAGLHGLETGMDVLVLTWLDQARREVSTVHPRGNPDVAERGVFATRSPSRPNPIGLHRVEILEVDGVRMKVRNLEAVDGTPILDVKPVLGSNDH